MRYITAVMLSSLATALVAFYAYPLYNGGSPMLGVEMGVVQIQGELKNVEKLTDDAKNAQARLTQLRAQRDQFRANEADIAELVAQTIDPVQLSYDIYNLGKRHGVSLANPSITKASSDAKAPYQKWNVAISFETNYDNALGLVNEIEYWKQLRDITSLSIVPGDQGSRTKVSLEFTTYSAK